MKKTTVWMGSILMAATAATYSFAVASPYQDTTKSTKAKKSKKTKATTAAAPTATTAPAPASKMASAKTTKSEATKNATPDQIAAAKSSGQVWVNTGTKVYHDSSSEFYGSTKAGKFMAEKDAIAAGYHKAKNEK